MSTYQDRVVSTLVEVMKQQPFCRLMREDLITVNAFYIKHIKNKPPSGYFAGFLFVVFLIVKL
jgi:hypothetical protein